MALAIQSVDSILPVNLDAERSILGAILLDNFCFTQAASLLQIADFSLDSHRRIYGHMHVLGNTGRPIDYVTLTEELQRNRELEAIGGVAYLTSLTDGLPRVQNIEHYIHIVRDKAILRGVMHAANQAMQAAAAQTESAADVLSAAESAFFQLSENRLGADFSSVQEIYQNDIGDLKKHFDRGHEYSGLETHYRKFDELTDGLQRSDLIIIAARPSMGKTAFALNIAENAAVLGNKVVGVFSLEMSKKALLLRLLCSQANVDSQLMRRGFLSGEDHRKLFNALGRLSEAPLYIDDTAAISVSEIRAKAQRLRHKAGALDLVVVDYLQLMSSVPVTGGRRPENRTQEVSAISRGLKMIAKDLNVPLVALSQLSRAAETRKGDRRPQLSDLRESGSIEQDADLVAFIFRPDYYESDPEEKTKLEEQGAEIRIDKQRNGPTGIVRLRFNKPSTRFENIEHFGDPPPQGREDYPA